MYILQFPDSQLLLVVDQPLTEKLARTLFLILTKSMMRGTSTTERKIERATDKREGNLKVIRYCRIGKSPMT